MAYFTTELDNSQTADKQEYLRILESDTHGDYDSLVQTMISAEKSRLVVNINDIREQSPDMAIKLCNSPSEQLPLFNMALKEYIENRHTAYLKDHEELFIGLKGNFGANHVTPRGLSARLLGQMICLEGIVTKCSLVRPKVFKSVHYCPATDRQVSREYRDGTSFTGAPTNSTYPTMDDDGNLLETEYGLSTYRDHQSIGVQEVPETAPPGQLPRSVDVILDDDLVDCVKPGDRVQITGTYRVLPSKNGGTTTAVFRTVLLANYVAHLGKEMAQPNITEVDVANIKKVGKDKNIFEILTRSVAPSIYGHENVKRGLLCLLLGGVEKNLKTGTHLRGDVNMMLIGDPSTAKSQLLRFTLNTAPLAIATTGRGSSGVGLTAAVTSDAETGERRLEAGAMVLADRGVVCIDEFDKMSDVDRVAIHEVMEQQTVTIAKAGIHTTLNARCSVLAAANPVYGQYNRLKSPTENIALPDSLLSRFDLLFIVLDKMEQERDRQISEHVLRMHRYRKPGEPDGAVIVDQSNLLVADDAEEVDGEDTVVYEKFDPMLHGDKRKSKNAEEQQKLFTIPFLKKYLHYAKMMTPTLSKSAADHISAEYAELRSLPADSKTMPITARTLETLIRLSTAHAKSRLSKTVDDIDAKVAVKIVSTMLFDKDAIPLDNSTEDNTNKRRPKAGRPREDSSDDDDGPGNDDDAPTHRTPQSQQTKRAKTITRSPAQVDHAGDNDDVFEFTDETASPVKRKSAESATPKGRSQATASPKSAGKQATPRTQSPPASATPQLDMARLAEFKAALYRIFSAERRQSIEAAGIVDRINGAVQGGVTAFSDDEVLSFLQHLSHDGKIMQTGGIIYLI